MTTIIEHLESFCGPIVEGWQIDAEGKKMPFQIVRLENGPVDGTATFSTLGLSNCPLKSLRSPQVIRHELVMLVRKNAIPKNLVPIMHQVGIDALSRDLAYLRGDVIGPHGILFYGTAFEALYSSVPVYFSSDFFGVSTENIGRVVFVWLVPITAEEARYVNENGWNKFEDKLANGNPDLLDLSRKSIIF